MRDEIETSDAPAAPQPKLTPANENPWYVLMTLYGEQEGDRIDWELHKKNRRAWNTWACQGFTLEELELAKSVVSRHTGDPDSWVDHSEELSSRFTKAFLSRNPGTVLLPEIPSPVREIDLSSIAFSATVHCDGMVFPREVSFRASNFGQEVGFDNCYFFGRAEFNDVVVKGEIRFWLTVFSNGCGFSGAKFEGFTFFGGTSFERGAHFAYASFFGGVHFFASVFKEGADFSCARFKGDVKKDRVDFGKAEIRRYITFSRAEFFDIYPNLGDASFPDSVTFTARQKPTPADIEDFEYLHNTTFWPERTTQNPEIVRQTCATIRHLLAKQGLSEDEHFFFRREMHFAGKIGSIWQRLPYLLFGLFSEYGYSILRPTLWLLGVWALGFAAFWGYFSGCCVPAPHDVIERPMGSAMALSFSNLFPLFGFGRTFLLEELKALPAVLQFFSGVQSVASLPLLFFLGLGLRQRFRLR
ncbi:MULTISPECIES: pentapeptide repeat-containing protein [unclassified Leisingera]|uniref:pentapeptide repeat-containing protein n=1 Tax=unclassified Leisingera TaxID=2614906 RepID=UPI001ED98C5B|nr:MULTISPECIES: pentapeptide repeat-containing protein [unclassified Leisingera]